MKRWYQLVFLCLVVFFGATAGPCSAEQWTDLGIKARDVSVAGTTIWVTGEDNKVYYATSSGWQQHATPLANAAVIDVGPDQKPVVTESGGWKIYKSNGSGWYQIPGATAARLSVDAQNRPWASLGGGRVFHFYDGQAWKNGNVGVGLGIESNWSGGMAAIGNGEGPHRITNGQWQRLEVNNGPKVADLDIDGRGHVWVADKGGVLWSHNKTQWLQHNPPQGARRVSVSESGQPVIVGRDGRVYACTDCGGQVAPPPQPTAVPPQVNRPPNAPTVEPGGYEPPFPLRYEGAIQLTWRNNGDPDGDPLAFWVEIWWWNANQGQWVQMAGTWAAAGATSYTLTIDNGLVANIYYAWRVAACDTAQRSDPWFAWSNYSVFRTVP